MGVVPDRKSTDQSLKDFSFRSSAALMTETQDQGLKQCPDEVKGGLQDRDQQHQEDCSEANQEEDRSPDQRGEVAIDVDDEWKRLNILAASSEVGRAWPVSTSSEERRERPKCCPPAPKKPKSQPSLKRRAWWVKRSTLLDVSKEVESMFPRAVLEDFGKKIKKARA